MVWHVIRSCALTSPCETTINSSLLRFLIMLHSYRIYIFQEARHVIRLCYFAVNETKILKQTTKPTLGNADVCLWRSYCENDVFTCRCFPFYQQFLRCGTGIMRGGTVSGLCRFELKRQSPFKIFYWKYDNRSWVTILTNACILVISP